MASPDPSKHAELPEIPDLIWDDAQEIIIMPTDGHPKLEPGLLETALAKHDAQKPQPSPHPRKDRLEHLLYTNLRKKAQDSLSSPKE